MTCNPELTIIDDEENILEINFEPCESTYIEKSIIQNMDIEEPNLIQLYGLDETLIMRCFMRSSQLGFFESHVYFKNENIYEGDVIDGWLHGRGKFTWAQSGVCYTGDFVKNMPTGIGRIDWPDGRFYEGQVLRGIRHGTGTYHHPSGLTYTGQWINGKKHGKGRLDYTTDGSCFYDGEWQDGLRHGFGTYQYAEGAIYEGQWKEGQRCGEGTLHWSACDEIYTGSWLNGKQHGLGCHAWHILRVRTSQYSLPNVYDGQWENGMRNGLGTFHYPNGSKYVGYWKNNLKHGRGTLILKDGRIFERMFSEDRLLSKGEDNVPYDNNQPHLERLDTRLPLLSDEPDKVVSEKDQINDTSDSKLLEHYLRPHVPSEYYTPTELRTMQNYVMENLPALRSIYQFYGRLGIEHLPDNTIIMRYLQFCQLIKNCKLHTRSNLATIDRVIAISYGTEEADEIQNPERLLSFGAFVNILVILACNLFIPSLPLPDEMFSYKNKVRNKPSEALVCLVTQYLLPNVCKTSSPLYGDSTKSREVLLFIEPIYNVYRLQAELRKPSGKPPSTITMRHFMMMMKNFNLFNDQLTPTEIVKILCAINPVAGPHDQCNMDSELTFFDFFEALVQIALQPTISTSEQPKAPATPENQPVMGKDATEEIVIKEISVSPDQTDSTTRRKSMSTKTMAKSNNRKGRERKQKLKDEAKSNQSSPVHETDEIIQIPKENPETNVDNRPIDQLDGIAEVMNDPEDHPVEIDEFTMWKTAIHHFFLERFLPAAQHFELCHRLAVGLDQSRLTSRQSTTPMMTANNT